jgi:metal-dependent amidase/aminoacylase/carboxypeptidase family protein
MSFEQQLISWRRELHQYPELSLQEVATTAFATGLRAACGCCPMS